MPIQHAIWTVGDAPKPLTADRLPSEQKLEEVIDALSSEDWSIRQWEVCGRLFEPGEEDS